MKTDKNLFNNISKLQNSNVAYWTGVLHSDCKRTRYYVEKLEISFYTSKIPTWIQCSPSLFGSYLAGIIDGDGDIRIHGMKRKLPQCYIRIADGSPNTELEKVIENQLNCKAWIYKSSSEHIYQNRKIAGT